MNKFAQSLGEFEPERNSYFEISNNEKVRDMLKTAASTVLPSLNANSIKKYVEKRIVSDFSAASGKIRVTLKPTNMSQSGDIKGADGQAIINIGREPIIIPFKIVGGEISDFSKIVIGGKTFPYNKSILTRIEGASVKQAQEDEPYIGTAKQYNADTDRGFMDDAIQIRDEFLRKNNYAGINQGGNRFVYASTGEVLENTLEKLASIKPVPQETLDRIEKDIMIKVADTYSRQIEKQALEIDPQISHLEQIFKKIDELPLKSIKDMKHGQKIMFPEKIGSEISMTQGVVFKDLTSLSDVIKNEDDRIRLNKNGKKLVPLNSDSEFNKFNNYKYMVVSVDGRVGLIKESDDFLALEDNNANFKLPTKTLSGVQTDEIYIPIIKNTVFMPQQMIDNRVVNFYSKKYDTSTHYSSNVGRDTESTNTDSKLRQLTGNSYPLKQIREFDKGGNNSSRYSTTESSLLMLPKGKFETGFSADEKIKLLYGEDVEGYLKLEAELPYRYFIIDDQTKVFKIKGFITGYTKKKGELKPGGADPILKFASDNFIVTEMRQNKGLYAAKTVGSKSRMFGKDLKKRDVTNIMKMLGYNKVQIAGCLSELETKGKTTIELPLNANINQLYNGKVENKTKSIMKKIVDKNFDKDKMKKAVKEQMRDLGANVAGSIAAESDTGYYILDQISKLGEEAEGCSILFEKIAVERRNHDLQHIAMACAAGKNLCDFIKEAYDSNSYYRGVKEACDYIEKNASTFEDVVTNISNLYDAQFEYGNELVPYSALKVAMEVIGDTVYMAQGINKVAEAAQDLVCKECGAKVDKPLKDGKCDECIKAEIADKNDEDVNSYTSPAQDSLDRGKTRGTDDYDTI